MKRSVASGVGVAAALLITSGVVPAAADDQYKGYTYEKASGDLSSYGWTVKIRSRVGSYLPTEQCIVTNGNRSSSRDSSGNSAGSIYLLDLNCNDTSALNGHAGNSVATPEGRKAKQRIDLATRFSAEYAKLSADGKGETHACFASENIGFCQKLCEETKSCSAEFAQALGL